MADTALSGSVGSQIAHFPMLGGKGPQSCGRLRHNLGTTCHNRLSFSALDHSKSCEQPNATNHLGMVGIPAIKIVILTGWFMVDALGESHIHTLIISNYSDQPCFGLLTFLTTLYRL